MIYGEKIRHVVQRYPDNVAIIYRDREFTNRNLDESSNAVIRGFYDLGLEKGDRIALLSRNCHHYREIFWVAGKGGFVLIPVNTRLTPREALYIIDNSEAKALIISREFADAIREIKGDLKHVMRYFSIDEGTDVTSAWRI